MSVLTAGDPTTVPGKRCRSCGAVGEWPGQPCPECKPHPDRMNHVTVPPSDAPVLHGTVYPEPGGAVDGTDLQTLANRVNEEHRQALRSGQEMIEHAISCGEALLEARAKVERGGWLSWLGRHVEVHVTTAHRYMRLATHREIVVASDVQSIEEAMRLLADKPRLGQGPRRFSREDIAAMVELHHEEGMGAVTKAYGVAKSTVWRYVSDKSPAKFDADATRPPHPAITEEAIERMAAWLIARFGDWHYPDRIVSEVRADALAALTAALGEVGS